MTVYIRLLVVEDDPVILEQWGIAVESFNAEESGVEIVLKVSKSLEEALLAVRDLDFDAAIVDINLKSENSNVSNQDGNIVLEKILDVELAVVAVLSGEPEGSAQFPDWFEGGKIFVKGEGAIVAAIEWLSSQAPMIKVIQQANNSIRREMVKLFTRSIWKRWSQWIDSPGDDPQEDFVEGALTRHLTAHIYATFLEKSSHKVHSEEWYFIPSIREGLRTGDLIKREDGAIEIIITPRCDLARDGKNESYQLAECKNVSADWNVLCEKVSSAKQSFQAAADLRQDTAPLEKAYKSKLSDVRRFSQHNGNSNVLHFLPELSIDQVKAGPFMINFDKIRSVRRDNAEEVNKLIAGKFASITPDFLPSIVERLGAYFSRIGSPDYSHMD